MKHHRMGANGSTEKRARDCRRDNEAALREALSKLLRPAGYGVQTFASAEDFLASEGWHSVDCLILDVQLPGMSGLALQRHLARKGFQAPVIFVTEDKDGHLAQALRGGALAFLRKPLDGDLLLRTVQCAWSDGAAGGKSP